MEKQEQKTATNFESPQEVSNKVDQMDEVIPITQLFKAAKDIVNNYSEFTNYSVITENSEMNMKGKQVENKDNENIDTTTVL